MHPRASLPEERLEVDPVRAVRLLAEEFRSTASASVRDAGPLSGPTTWSDRERAEERQARAPAPRDGEVVVATRLTVDHAASMATVTPPNATARASRTRHGAARSERQQADDEERLVRGPDSARSAGRGAEQREPRDGGPERGLDRDRRPDREGRGEDDVSGEPVEERRRSPGRAGARRRRGRPGHGRTEARCARRGAPSRRTAARRSDDDDRAAEVEDPADDERGDRRPVQPSSTGARGSPFQKST